MVKRLYFLLSLLLLAHILFGQEYFEVNKVIKNTINYNSLSDNDFGHSMFNVIGLDNNISVKKIELQTKSRLLLIISRNSQRKLTAKISLTRVSIVGSTSLRNFIIDTLLWPSYITAKLTLYNGKHKRGTIDIKLSANGKLKAIDLTNYLTSNIGDVSATITNIKFGYNKDKYIQLQAVAENIRYYYSFGILLKQLLKQQSTAGENTNQQSAKIFVNKILMDRVTNNIQTHKLVNSLNLSKNDPIGFLKLIKKLNRLSIRTTTLFNQQLSNLDTDSISPTNFILGYCKVSSDYLSYAKTLQPSDASGFEEIAKIYNAQNSKETLLQVDAFYSQNKNNNAIITSQKIFNQFVKMADNAIDEDNYTEAILLLNNALLIHNWYNTILTSSYNSLVSIALDGVASSFLKVGDIALRTNNQALANVYFSKADNIVISNENIFESLQNTDTAFSEYLRLQHKIATQYIDNQQFSNALTRLSYGRYICSKLNKSNNCYSIDSAVCIAYSGLITSKLDSLDSLITVGQYPDAYIKLGIINKYISKNSCFINNDNARFLNLAYSLFNKFLQNGEILIDANQSQMALYSLLKAKSIQTNYLLDTLDKLDILIKFAAEPNITTLIDDAKYHTWANRMDKANILYLKATDLNRQYFNGSNIRINAALTDLGIQISSRKCITFKIKYIDLIKRAHIAIKYNNYDKLNAFFKEAQTYITNYPDCKIQNNELIKLEYKYATVIEFYKEYDIVVDNLFKKGYKNVIEKYVSLIDFYNKNNLTNYEIVIPDIKVFIETQNLLNLTMATANYYLKNHQYNTSFDYIKIYKNQGGGAKDIKHISNEIAKNLAKHDAEINKPTKDAIQQYTEGNGWYNSFKIAYLKNRIIN